MSSDDMTERERGIEAIMGRKKTREQAEAFLNYPRVSI